jgi:orotate phosphoribosyltransferase
VYLFSFTMQTPRQQLLSLIASISFKLGHFKLSSGGTSDYYLDCRLTTLHAEGARLTARVVLDEIKRRGWNPRAIGGMTLGADPIVTAVAMLSAQEAQAAVAAVAEARAADQGLIHGFLVRKAEKSHGMEQRLEGYREPGVRAVIVEDVVTTGASTISAITAARAAGFEIAGVLCLVEREDANGRPALEQAASPAPFIRLFTAEDVRQEHLRQLAAKGQAVR